MTKTIDRIVSYKATDSNKSFCLSMRNGNSSSVEMYYADIEEYLSVNAYSYNKGCLRNANANTIYSALYNAKDLYYKSALYGSNVDTVLPNTHAFQNTFNYRLSVDLSNQIQVENYIYQLNNMSNCGKMAYSQDIYSELSLNNGYAKMPNVSISTLKFDKTDLSIAKEDDTHQISVCNIPGIQYNQFFEIPGTVKNDYDSGNYAANVYTTKNLYTSQYDMLHSGNTVLSCARQYIAIDHCNNQVYLKYYDNVNYYGENSDMSVEMSCLYGHKFQKIEVLKALNRFESINFHKTNYYDVDVVCEKLMSSFSSAKNSIAQEKKDKIDLVKQNLKREIQNCIQDICKQISPIDTQLVKVNVLESEVQIS